MHVQGGDNDHAMDENQEFPGQPWEHYLVKDRARGFKCLKCSKMWHDVSEIRAKPCKIPRPEPEQCPSPLARATAAHGASAAVVGEELATLGCSELATFGRLEREKAALEEENQKLMELLAIQELHELELELQEAELEAQIQEYNFYESEEAQLSRALRESLEEDQILEANVPEILGKKSQPVTESTPTGSTPTPSAYVSEAAAESDMMPPPAPVGSKRKEPEKGDEPTTAMPKKAKLNSDELPLLSPDEQKPYQKYWSRFVATPQIGGYREPHGPCLASPPPAPTLVSPAVSTTILRLMFLFIADAFGAEKIICIMSRFSNRHGQHGHVADGV